MSTSRWYNTLKRRLWKGFGLVPPVHKMVRKTGNAIKHGLLQNSNLFESLNFRYFGVVDGHNIEELITTLRALRDIGGPKLLHIKTKKGKGYAPAEADPATWHAPGRFDVATGERVKSSYKAARYQDVFGDTMVDLARMDERVVGITPAMPSGCSLNIMMREMPERCFDVGIAEGHAVTFSAGLAAAGSRPFCNIYSSFMQRAYDNVIHDIALQNLPVVLCLDRAGIVGEDGATHHGAFDMASFACIPNMIVAAPMDEAELRNMLYTAVNTPSPYSLRYPRGSGEGVAWRGEPFVQIPTGRGRRLKDGDDVAVLTIGTVGNFATQAISEVEAEGGERVAHYDMRFVKPLDIELLAEVGKKYKKIITVEDGILRGGVGEAITKWLSDNGYHPQVVSLGIGDNFVEHGTLPELYALCGYDVAGIVRAIKSMQE
jgi:1-deoxy-D-xylulose-5-phosphate synthase